jgi:hypothetical protein
MPEGVVFGYYELLWVTMSGRMEWWSDGFQICDWEFQRNTGAVVGRIEPNRGKQEGWERERGARGAGTGVENTASRWSGGSAVEVVHTTQVPGSEAGAREAGVGG